MRYELSDQVVKNLGVFLNEVPIKGHQARMAMNEVCDALSRPIPEKKKKEEDKVGAIQKQAPIRDTVKAG